MDEMNRAGELKPGQTLALSAFGAGLVTGACILTWNP
jgi:3-oxoacyl-[acyl-carrier-protein] synthase-3